jgi:alanyl-tRNA synthetase
MTDRIYYTDPECRAFDATVLRSFDHEGRPAVILDRSAFYPTSGGQPFDTGRLDRRDVVDTTEVNGDVVHVLSAPLDEGATVHGEVDWPRRFDHMQQHSGQHVLSAAFERVFDNRTLGFHLGAEASTIDLARELTAVEVERAVDEANRVVWDDRPVTIRFVSEHEARRLPLRREPTREGILRLIEVPDFDLSACGGTHVSRTGVIGVIAVTAVERFKGGARVSFVCGGRALRSLRSYRDAVTACVRVLSVTPSELPLAVERVQGEAKDLRKAIVRLQESLAGHEAARLLVNAPRLEGRRAIVEVIEGWEPPGLKAIAQALSLEAGVVAVLVSAATPSFVVAACSADLKIDANRIVRHLIERFGGRGGGKSDLAQGGGLTGGPSDIAAAARELLQA